MITRSLCNMCLSEVPAKIETAASGVFVIKMCPVCGPSAGMIEKDVAFFKYIRSLDRGSIYNGVFIDITGKCNLKCEYCYHGCGGEHVSIIDLAKMAQRYQRLTPYFLSGGEPTIHPEFFEVLRMFRYHAPTVLVTNCTMMQDKAFCEETVGILESPLTRPNSVAVGLSYHKEAGDALSRTLDNIGCLGKKAGTVLWVVSSLDDVDECLTFCDAHEGAIAEVRMKVATSLGSEPKNCGLFASDIYRKLEGCKVKEDECNKTSYIHLEYKGRDIKLVQWYNRSNIDLNDINCAPWYVAKDGSVNNLVTTCIKNERLCE